MKSSRAPNSNRRVFVHSNECHVISDFTIVALSLLKLFALSQGDLQLTLVRCRHKGFQHVNLGKLLIESNDCEITGLILIVYDY